MEPSTLSPWISLALSAIALATVVYGWFTAGEKKALAEVGKLRAEIAAVDAKLATQKDAHADAEKITAGAVVARFALIESRVQSIEGELKHLPDGDAAHRLELAVTQLSGQISVLEERMKPIAAINERLQEWALERSK
jgi:hypothetical protein